ncbi:helix-turn-helix domain-containing protein [Streptomyces sp. NPDC058953]|uniref:helix-turn-helix domain-containing protein n=1 Tax=unclassified Streptomyces TaxID=2593676 RepID=UPI00367A6822
MAMENDHGRPEPTSSLLAFFGSRLLKLRIEHGWSQNELATKAHTTGAMISYVEHAKRVPSADLAQDLDRAFGTEFFAEFYPLVVRYAYPSWFLPYVKLEEQAIGIRMFDSQVVPGLLQTESYARATLAAMRPDSPDDLLAARMTRQTLFERDDPPYCWFIIDEQALRRNIGGLDVMAAQLERLLVLGREPRIVIQIVPEEVAAHPGLAGPFTLLSFDQSREQGSGKPPHDVLYVDGFSQGRTALEREEVTAATRAYDLLISYALSPEASAERVSAHLEKMR